MAPLEPWQKVLVSRDDFLGTAHGDIACIYCHAGVNSADKDAAHAGLVADPSAAPQRACDDCHLEQAHSGSSLHGTLEGYWTTLEGRGAPRPQYDVERIRTLMKSYNTHCGSCHTNCSDCHYLTPGAEDVMLVKQDVVDGLLASVDHLAEIRALQPTTAEQAMQTMFGNHCSSCHASCGDCHVSQPEAVGGGFVQGHAIMKTPSMSQNCTACHGSRVGNEYLGKHEDIPGDAHFRLERMNCVACHTGEELHDSQAACTQCHDASQGVERTRADRRYAGSQNPACESCHTDNGAWNDLNENHTLHKGKLACQVCHSVSYTSCDGCHVAVSEKTGNPFFVAEGDYLSFFIGRNPSPGYHRPYEYVVVRHAPAAVDSFAFYGADLLPAFDSLPTWLYATPHNIQRETPQNRSCNACHGNGEIFLTRDKVQPGEWNANRDVIIEQVPGPVEQP